MKHILYLLLICFTLSACSLPARSYTDIDDFSHIPQEGLSRIKIKRWGKVVFSGMLGLKENEGILKYVLLDPSGLTLLGAEIKKRGDYTVSRVDGVLQESRLPVFFAKSLERIFLSEPTSEPCSVFMISKLCKYSDGLEGNRLYTSGPFVLWKAEKKIADQGQYIINYQQPLLGVEMIISSPDVSLENSK